MPLTYRLVPVPGRRSVALERLVRRETLTLLYGASGLGKTSLVRAGLIPRLRAQADVLPVYVRLDFAADAPSSARQLLDALRAAMVADAIDGPSFEGAGSVWEALHAREGELWNANNRIVTPLFILDQFEELARAVPSPRADEALAELAALAENRPPDAVIARSRADAEYARTLDASAPRCKVLLTFREDYLVDLEGPLTQARVRLGNRLRLEPLTREQALVSVRGTGGALIGEGAAEAVVDAVSRQRMADHRLRRADAVDPALLSLICRELNERRLAAGAARIEVGDVKRERRDRVLRDFYARALEGFPDTVHDFVEGVLITKANLRDSVAMENALALPGVTPGVVRELESRRLVRRVERDGRVRVELSHDVLLDVVRQSRDERAALRAAAHARAEQAEAEHRKKMERRSVIVGVPLILVQGSVVAVVIMFAFYGWSSYRHEALSERTGAFILGVLRSLQADLESEKGHRAAVGANIAWLLRNAATPEALERAADWLSTAQELGAWIHHDGRVQRAAFSPDGERVLTASYDSTARLWNARTGAPLGSPMRHSDVVLGATFSPNGMRIVTASADGTARLWDAQTGAPVAVPLVHDDRVRHASFSPDGRRVVTTSDDGSARLWDANSGASLAAALRHGYAVNYAVFSADGRRVVTASDDGTARIWDGNTGARIGAPLRHDAPVFHAAFSPDGRQVVTASSDYSARRWDARTGAQLGAALRHEDAVVHAAFSSDGKRVITASLDHSARLWDARTDARIGEPLQHDDWVRYAAFSPDDEIVVTVSDDATARLWSAQTGALLGANMQHGREVVSAAFSPDGQRIVTASWDGTVRLWDRRAFAVLGVPLPHRAGLRDATFSRDGQRVVTASEDGTARLWDVLSGAPLGAPLTHDSAVTRASFSVDGERVVTASEDGTARLWDARTGAPLGAPITHSSAVTSAAFSFDGLRIVTASQDSTARLWDARTGAAVGRPLAHHAEVVHASFSPDGRRVVTASRDGTARLWDAHTGAPIGPPLAHDDDVVHASFSPDGDRVVTASWDNTARLWDARTNASHILTFRHKLDVVRAVFSPSGRHLVTASADGSAQLWDARSGNPVGHALRHRKWLASVAFSANGQRVVTASGDSSAQLWRTPIELTAEEHPKGRSNWEDFYLSSTRQARVRMDSLLTRSYTELGRRLGVPLTHRNSVTSAEFSPDGLRVLTSSADGTARIWDVRTLLAEDAVPAADLIEAICGRRIDESGARVIVRNDSLLIRLSTDAAFRESYGRSPAMRELVRWRFTDPAIRSIHPSTTMTHEEYQRRLAGR